MHPSKMFAEKLYDEANVNCAPPTMSWLSKMKLAFVPKPVQSIRGKAFGLTGVTPMLVTVAGRLTHAFWIPPVSH